MTTGLNMIADYLTSVPAWFLATCSHDRPHVRPFSFVATGEGKLWFCTATTKDVYRELQENPAFELSAWRPGSGWIIVSGTAEFSDSASEVIRRAGYIHLRTLGESYIGPDDPRLAFFTLTDGRAWLCDIDGSHREIDLSPEADCDHILAENAATQERLAAEDAEISALLEEERQQHKKDEEYGVYSELVE